MNYKLIKKYIKFAAKEKYQEKERDKWCVRCALGNAKSVFDKKYSRYKLPTSELLNQFVWGFQETTYDQPLVESRDYLASINQELLFDTKSKAIQFMLKSINGL